MANIKGLEVDRRVGIALSVLSPAQKQLVESVTRSPQVFARMIAKPGLVRQMANSGQPLYEMRISRALSLIYTMVGDTVYVVDLVERETLKRFARRNASTAKPRLTVASKKSTGSLSQ